MFYHSVKANVVANALSRKSRDGETDSEAYEATGTTVCNCVD